MIESRGIVVGDPATTVMYENGLHLVLQAYIQEGYLPKGSSVEKLPLSGVTHAFYYLDENQVIGVVHACLEIIPRYEGDILSQEVDELIAEYGTPIYWCGLAISPNYRDNGLLVWSFIDMAFTQSKNLGAEIGFIIVNPTHKGAYKRSGFVEVKGTLDKVGHLQNAPGVMMYITKKTRSESKAMVERISRRLGRK